MAKKQRTRRFIFLKEIKLKDGELGWPDLSSDKASEVDAIALYMTADKSMLHQIDAYPASDLEPAAAAKLAIIGWSIHANCKLCLDSGKCFPPF